MAPCLEPSNFWRKRNIIWWKIRGILRCLCRGWKNVSAKHCRRNRAIRFMKEKPSSTEAKRRGKCAGSARLNQICTPVSMAGPSTVLVHCWSGPAGRDAKALPQSAWLLQLPWEAILKRAAWRVLQRDEGRTAMRRENFACCFPGLKSSKSLITWIPAPTKLSQSLGIVLQFLLLPGSIIEAGMSITCHLSIHCTPFSLCAMLF